MHINILIRETDAPIPDMKNARWAGVDRGVYLLLEAGVTPLFTYGDFDSITEAERRYIDERLDINPVESEKDDTDLEIALLDLAGKGYASIDVYGATGGRLDHLFGNVQLLLNPELAGVRIRIIDPQNVLELLGEGEHEPVRNQAMRYVSFIPLFQNTVLTLDGFKYPLEQTPLTLGSTLTISNEFLHEKAYVKTSQPILMIQSND
ncbi:thiamine diphosphokinase [Salinicoccus halitifaciens]|uniref:Thiamine diphosphokinase n=1 Tax=Salinicoccus halitifaciens TaxID=1073415 RepID=A0ABV2E7D2_9STAP|nr:thiamine diphosphokinase [Salinicoccus halitifaciens]MCD2136619.1 thiamine diphosphokinase [Salinicoccus halitifaciens]